MSGDAEARFWAKVDKSGECWLWLGTKYNDGYGQFYVNGSKVRAHRWSYELLVGPIPDGLVIDHLCRVRNCVNPAHLEPVTNRENLLRGEGPSAIAARATSCIHGHEFTEANTCVKSDGSRRCRACHRDSARRNRGRFVCNLCGAERDKSQRLRHLRSVHPEVMADA